MLQCLAVAVRPLRIKELAELLAFEFKAQGAVPKYRTDWRPNDQVEAVLSTFSSLISIVDDNDSRVVQLSHFSVKEFLMSDRVDSSFGDFSRYHVLPGPAHAILAQACLGFLLHLDGHVGEDIVKKFPLAEYAAKHWITHAQFEGVALRVRDGMETLFDCDKPHFAAWLGIHDIDEQSFGELPSKIPTPLYYSSLCGFSDLVEHLAIKHPQHVNAIGGWYEFPLRAALVGKHVRVVEILLDRGASGDIRGARDRTLLHEAIADVRMVKSLLDYGMDVNCQQDDLRTPLHLAASQGELGVAAELLKHKAKADPLDSRGNTPLHLLFEDKHRDVPDLARLLLEHGADVNRRDQDNNTPLHLAMGSWMYKCARILLEHGAEVNVGNNESKTPLHLLFENGYSDEEDLFDIARLLIEHGADVNIRAADEWAPLHWAAFDGRLSIASLLLEHGARVNAENEESEVPLLLVSRGNYNSDEQGSDVARLLLERNANVNAPAKNKWTPLHWAAFNGRLEITRLLLDHGANTNVGNDYGETPLHLVSASKNDSQHCVGITSLLLKCAADTNALDKGHATSLHWAAFKGRLEIARILLYHGANANAKNDQGETPLHLVSRGKCDSPEVGVLIVCLLLEHGADINARTKSKWTPLHSASFNGGLKIMTELLDKGANANAENDQGETPLHLVSRSNHIPEEQGVGIAELLLERGSDTKARDNDNTTPLQLARYRGKLDIARVLLDYDENADPESDKDPVSLYLGLEGEHFSVKEDFGVQPLVTEHNTESEEPVAPLHQA
jgi:ankyrin repeat protein